MINVGSKQRFTMENKQSKSGPLKNSIQLYTFKIGMGLNYINYLRNVYIFQ